MRLSGLHLPRFEIRVFLLLSVNNAVHANLRNYTISEGLKSIREGGCLVVF